MIILYYWLDNKWNPFGSLHMEVEDVRAHLQSRGICTCVIKSKNGGKNAAK